MALLVQKGKWEHMKFTGPHVVITIERLLNRAAGCVPYGDIRTVTNQAEVLRGFLENVWPLTWVASGTYLRGKHSKDSHTRLSSSEDLPHSQDKTFIPLFIVQ